MNDLYFFVSFSLPKELSSEKIQQPRLSPDFHRNFIQTGHQDVINQMQEQGHAAKRKQQHHHEYQNHGKVQRGDAEKLPH